mgnify:CR=1 FL=1
MTDPIDKIIAILRNGSAYNTGDLGSSAGVKKKVLINILSKGRGSVFKQDADKWRFNTKVPESKIVELRSSVKSDMMHSEHVHEDRTLQKSIEERSKRLDRKKNNALEKLKSWGKGSSTVVHGEGTDLNSSPSRSSWGDGLSKGRVKTYIGPQGTYWANDTYSQKNVMAGSDQPTGPAKIKYGKRVKATKKVNESLTRMPLTLKKSGIYTYCVYVLEIDENPKKVYVGQTYLTPEIRLNQHRSGIHGAPSIKHAKKLKLRPDLYKDYARVYSRDDSLKLESKVADKLRKLGYRVEGGH